MVKIRKNEDFKISTCPATKTFRQGDGTSGTFVLKSMYLNVSWFIKVSVLFSCM